MGGLLLLLALSVVMALASFLAGALPLSITLSQSQLRLISSIGIGILVGTSLIVIIPEGIEAIASASSAGHSHSTRSLIPITGTQGKLGVRMFSGDNVPVLDTRGSPQLEQGLPPRNLAFPEIVGSRISGRDDADKGTPGSEAPKQEHHDESKEHGGELPTFYIGLSLILGFVLMYLIDKLPRHATDRLQTEPQTRHISLDNLGGSTTSGDEESEGFLGSIAPSPKQSRSLATTTGLVIHAAADGIAMGASTSTSNTKLGLIIFVAIMVHKAPAAFGLTSVLLRQGLSKRAARGHLIVFSLAAPFGALTTWALISLIGGSNMDGESGQWWTGMLLLFSAGTFLYVAMHAMQEDGGSSKHDHHGSMNGYSESNGNQRNQNRPQMRDTFATVAGMLLPLLTQFGHHH